MILLPSTCFARNVAVVAGASGAPGGAGFGGSAANASPPTVMSSAADAARRGKFVMVRLLTGDVRPAPSTDREVRVGVGLQLPRPGGGVHRFRRWEGVGSPMPGRPQACPDGEVARGEPDWAQLFTRLTFYFRAAEGITGKPTLSVSIRGRNHRILHWGSWVEPSVTILRPWVIHLPRALLEWG